jgi:hypothetical protein
MVIDPDPTLYPDVTEYGGLAAALVGAGRTISIDLSAVSAIAGSEQKIAAVLETRRGAVVTVLGADRRCFVVNINGDTHVWATGGTEDLQQVAQVADAWRNGLTLQELHSRFPFMSYDRMAQAYEDGNPIAVRWRELLEDPNYSDVHPLLEAAHSSDKLGQLFPSVSMYTRVRFALDHKDRDAGEILIDETPEGGYSVVATWNQVHRTAASIHEAIAEAIALLP